MIATSIYDVIEQRLKENGLSYKDLIHFEHYTEVDASTFVPLVFIKVITLNGETKEISLKISAELMQDIRAYETIYPNDDNRKLKRINRHIKLNRLLHENTRREEGI